MTADHVKGREPPRRIRRVYKIVSLGEADGKHRLLLDGKPAHTPMRLVMETPHCALAEAVAAEWDAQVENIFPETMPMTRLLATAIDRIEPQRAAVIAALMTHVHADLLCYRADHPPALAQRQRAAWQPVLDWIETTQGVSFTVVDGVMPQQQSADAVGAMETATRALDVDRLTAFQACAAAAGSLALALALVHGRVNADQVIAATNIDESFQIETWGEDELAQERRASIARDVTAAATYLRLVT